MKTKHTMQLFAMPPVRHLVAMIWLIFAVASGLSCGVAHAAGPVETSVFAVQGVDVDVTDVDAATAKDKALIEVQIKAFKQLAEKLGNAALVEAVGKMADKQILPYLKSLSIEQEAISPGHYQGKFTVRFLPAKVKALYSSFGVEVASDQGPSFLILPVWTGENGQVLWGDNPWRKAWVDLHAEQSAIPVIVPLGDIDDTEALSVTDVINNDPVKIEAIRRRYDVKAVIIAFASPAEGGGVHATMTGDSPLGKLSFDKTYTADSGDMAESAALAAQRFHAVMVEKYQSGVAKTSGGAADRTSLKVSIPFTSPSEWNGLRSRILSTPGVAGVDVASLGIDGAVVTVTFAGTLDDFGNTLASNGLSLQRVADAWVITPR